MHNIIINVLTIPVSINMNTIDTHSSDYKPITFEFNEVSNQVEQDYSISSYSVSGNYNGI